MDQPHNLNIGDVAVHEACRSLWIQRVSVVEKHDLNLNISFMLSNKVSLNMRAGQTSCLKIHNTWQVVPFNNLLFPPFTTLNTSPPLPPRRPDWNESIKAILIRLSLYALPLAEFITKWAALKMSVQIDTRTWAVMSAATCSSPNVFCSAVQGHRQWV